MHTFLSGRSLLSLALAATGFVAALGSAAAADRDTTEIRFDANGAEQRVVVDMTQLAPGQSRQLTADSGLPAIVTRTDEGLRVEIAGEIREIALPPVEVIELGGDGDSQQIVLKRHRVDGAAIGGDTPREVRVVRHVRSGDEVDSAELDALIAEALA
ncbi:hypothetical protein [Aquimonas sp.]|jgi:hypothetical protein|uniref:hypothetical protein n=1 Tax=Aquimonas sp. TaxID=1872588 RepID=UPI0037BE2F9C